MWDIIEMFLNLIGTVVVGSLLIEYGLSRLLKKNFSVKHWWAILVIAFGVKLILTKHMMQ